MSSPVITVVIPSFNQGEYLVEALESVYVHRDLLEIFVMDGGSTDRTLGLLRRWEDHIDGWISGPDDGQAAAINAGVRWGTAPYVCWLNSDDFWLPEGLLPLLDVLERRPDIPAAYGRVDNLIQSSGKLSSVWVERFSEERLARRCIVSQPASLIRRSAWEAVGGLDEHLSMAMDYDLWWRLFKRFGELGFVDEALAVNRVHSRTKTQSFRAKHYREAMWVVGKYYGHIPLKWWIYQPYSVWYKTLLHRIAGWYS